MRTLLRALTDTLEAVHHGVVQRSLSRQIANRRGPARQVRVSHDRLRSRWVSGCLGGLHALRQNAALLRASVQKLGKHKRGIRRCSS